MKLSIEKQPVILLHSSLDNDQIEKECLDLGIRFRLSKPVKSSDLFNYLNNIFQENSTGHDKVIIEVPKADDARGGFKILVAEDVFLNMVLIKAMLSELGFTDEIVEAKNGIEAIEKYQQQSPDLILMDVHMPELDGIRATKKIREIESFTGNKVPIIALTAGALKEEKEKCFANGMNDFLSKPLTPEKLLAMINKYLIKGKNPNESIHLSESESEIHISYQELMNSFNNKSIIKKVLNIALQDVPVQILELEEACKEKQPEKIHSAAHKIKGSSSYLRFNLLAEIAAKIEGESMDAWNDHIVLHLSELKAEWELVKKIIESKLAQPSQTI